MKNPKMAASQGPPSSSGGGQNPDSKYSTITSGFGTAIGTMERNIVEDENQITVDPTTESQIPTKVTRSGFILNSKHQRDNPQ